MPTLDTYTLPILSPVVTAITVAEIKTEVRQDSADDDTAFASLRDASIWTVEQEIGKSLIQRTLVMRFSPNELGGVLPLWMGPVASITSIVGTLRDDTTTTVDSDNYYLTDDQVVLKTYNGAVWPSVMRPVNGLAVTYVSGYGVTQASIPHPIQEAAIKYAAAMYDEPDKYLDSADLPAEVLRLLVPFRRWRI